MIRLLRERSRELFDFLDHSSDVYAVADSGQTCLFINKTGRELLGVDELKVSQTVLSDLFGKSRKQFEATFINKALHSGKKSIAGRIRLKRKDDGQEIPFHLKLSVFYQKDNRPAYFMVSAKDLSKELTQQEPLRKQIQFKQSLMNSLEDGILVIDHRTRRVSDANEKFFELWRIPKELKMERDDEKLISHVLSQLKDPDQFIKKVLELYERPFEKSYDVLEFSDGCFFDRSSYPVFQDDEVISRIWVFKDVTSKLLENRRNEEQKAMLAHQSKLASIGELAAGVGHEINNPLAIVKGYNEKIKKDVSKGIAESDLLLLYTTKIQAAVERMRTIIDGLRKFSRNDIEDVTVFDAEEAISESISLIREIYSRANVLVSFQNQTSQKCFIEANQGKFQQVLMNLLSNAKDAVSMQDSGEVTVILSSTPKRVLVDVFDSGEGIPKQERKKIFEPFFTTKPSGKGTGIGLSLARTFANEMNASLKYEMSKKGESVFRLKFPRSKNPTKVSRTEGPKRGKTQFQARVLVVEDEAELRAFLCGFLEELGLEVLSAENGQSAYETLMSEKESVQIVLSDVDMPKVNGYQLLERLRSNSDIKQPRFVLFSGRIDWEFSKSSKPHQLDGFFSKPFEEDEIIQVLTDCLEEHEKKSA